MIQVGIISNLCKDIGGKNAGKIIRCMKGRNMNPLVSIPVYQLLNVGTPLEEKKLYQQSDLILVLGGDGTILRAARPAAIYGKPILGMNLGQLGFMAEAEMADCESILDALSSGSYHIEKRMMLDAEVLRDGKAMGRSVALNDMAVAKSAFARMIHLEVQINGEFVNHYAADGLLISSPTGSTAYSLSAGGPVIQPDMECLLVTPICPHTLNSRPIVTNPCAEVEVEVQDKDRNMQLTADGQETVELQDGDRIRIHKSNRITQLICLPGSGFFHLLRSKLSVRTD